MSELLKINVSSHTEKKNGLTYLSWAWAWAEVLKIDPQATWEAVEFNGLPCAFLPDSSAMVKTVVTIKGHSKSCWLPVMNHSNKAIKGPDAFAINTAIVRCLTKAISMHGLGLYIYAGEDLPEGDETASKARAEWLQQQHAYIMNAENMGALKRVLSEAVAVAMQQDDSAAVDQLNAWAEEKRAQAKPKAVA